jgi:hypothetical protein
MNLLPIEVLAELLTCVRPPGSRDYAGLPPTEASIHRIAEQLGFTLPDAYIQVASAGPQYGACFAGIGEDYDHPFHILSLRKRYLQMGLPPRYAVFGLINGGDIVCWDLKWLQRRPNPPVVRCECTFPDQHSLVLNGAEDMGGAYFHEHLDALCRYEAPRSPDEAKRRSARAILAPFLEEEKRQRDQWMAEMVARHPELSTNVSTLLTEAVRASRCEDRVFGRLEHDGEAWVRRCRTPFGAGVEVRILSGDTLEKPSEAQRAVFARLMADEDAVRRRAEEALYRYYAPLKDQVKKAYPGHKALPTLQQPADAWGMVAEPRISISTDGTEILVAWRANHHPGGVLIALRDNEIDFVGPLDDLSLDMGPAERSMAGPRVGWIDDAVLGAIFYDGGCWVNTIATAFGPVVELRVDPDDAAQRMPTDLQRSAFTKFLAEQDAVHQRVEKALYEYYLSIQDWLNDPANILTSDPPPVLEKPGDVWNMLENPVVLLPAQEAEPTIVLYWSSLFHDGVQVVLKNNHVASVSPIGEFCPK